LPLSTETISRSKLLVADIRAQGIDEIVNLGDMASGPLDARRTMDALMATPDARYAILEFVGGVWRATFRHVRSRRDGRTGARQRPARTRIGAGDGVGRQGLKNANGRQFAGRQN
jgi:hypothetical protein